jgi:uncharacterized protein (TIGR00730 family)
VASICVFCGSNSGIDPAHRAAAVALGSTIARGGHELIYGGGHVGLMGVVADSVIGGGGAVTGVMTEQLVAAEVAHDGLTRLEVTADMHSRKARMSELADGVVVLPGGFGTFDEAFEILTWNQLGLICMPIVFLDVAGFYVPLFEFIEGAVAAGFVKPAHGALAQRASDPDDAVRLACSPAPNFSPKWIT